MGEKYQLMFLSNLESNNILTNVSTVVSKFGWHYNRFDFGKYSYWSDGPIWELGTSKEVTEFEIDNNDNMNRIRDIIEFISQFYSQSIVFHKLNNDKIISSIVSIIELSTLPCKEVCVSFELNDLLTSIEMIDLVTSEIKDIFVNLSININPFYGMSAIEMKGLVEGPKKLKIENLILGDFNFFSFECPDLDQFNNISEEYEIYDHDNIGRFIFTSKYIGEYK